MTREMAMPNVPNSAAPPPKTSKNRWFREDTPADLQRTFRNTFAAFGVLIATICILLPSMVPKFVEVYESLYGSSDRMLPWQTNVLISVPSWLWYGIGVLFAILFGAIGVRGLKRPTTISVAWFQACGCLVFMGLACCVIIALFLPLVCDVVAFGPR